MKDQNEPTAQSDSVNEPVVLESNLSDDNTLEQSRISQRRRRLFVGAIIVIVLCFAAGLGGVRLYEIITGTNGVTQRNGVKDDGNKIVTQEEEDVASVVGKVSPSVVSIVTKSQSRSQFGTTEQDGAGTGIVVSKDGYILTNKHVVADANTVGVVTSDGTRYEDVKVLGTDPLNDVAFLKVGGVNDLRAAELGDSSSIRVGQKVIAIGNSLGQYQNTVTSGIISGTGRPISAQAGDAVESLTDLLQTDAAINPGNSGGPLLNLSGQVIGINTAIIEDAQGIGFSIPINATKGILKGVLEGKGVKRAFLGINYVPITADVAKQYKLSVKTGAYVYNGTKSAVVSNSPAAEAGIKDKDIITKVGDVEVGDKGGVSSLVAEYAPDDTIELTVLRDGKTQVFRVTLDAYKG